MSGNLGRQPISLTHTPPPYYSGTIWLWPCQTFRPIDIPCLLPTSFYFWFVCQTSSPHRCRFLAMAILIFMYPLISMNSNSPANHFPHRRKPHPHGFSFHLLGAVFLPTVASPSQPTSVGEDRHGALGSLDYRHQLVFASCSRLSASWLTSCLFIFPSICPHIIIIWMPWLSPYL